MSSVELTKSVQKNLLKNKGFLEKFTAVAALLLMIIIFSIFSPNFFTLTNLLSVSLQTSIIAFVGIGVTFVIITAGIDLGIGSVVALSGVVAGLAMRAGYPVTLSILLGLMTGAICGLFNGFVITRLLLPPFIATLGTQMIARGLALYVTNAYPITGFPPSFDFLGGKIPGTLIPVPVVIMILAAFIFSFILRKTRLGRYAYATGSNEEAARLSGININRTKYLLYMISGILAAVAGIVLASRLSTAQATAGNNYELDGIASAVIGGTSLMGGVGTISGTMIGAFIIGVMRNGLNMLGVSNFIQQMTIGGVIILAVYIDSLRNKKA
jgi:ribose transport system permease protein